MFMLGWQLILSLVVGAFCKDETTTAPGKEGSGIRLPNVPQSLDEFRYASRFVSVWENRLFELNETKKLIKEKESEDSRPKMILAPSESQMDNLLPQNAPDPLYSKKYGSLADNFILDSLSTGILNHEDNRLETPEGHALQSMSGKCLLFKRDLKTGQLNVNGIKVLGIRKTIGQDPVTVFELNGFLFNHRSEISEAFNALFREASSKNTKLSATSKQPILTSKSSTSTTTEPKTITMLPKATTSNRPTTMAHNISQKVDSTLTTTVVSNSSIANTITPSTKMMNTTTTSTKMMNTTTTSPKMSNTNTPSTKMTTTVLDTTSATPSNITKTSQSTPKN